MGVIKYRNSAADPWQEIQTINGENGIDGQDCNIPLYLVTTDPTETDPNGLYFVTSPEEEEGTE